MVVVSYEIVARADVREYRLASLPDPRESLVDGTKFPGGAGGPRGINPGGAGGGCDHWSPKRLGLRGAGDGSVNSPACRAVGKRRAVNEQEGGGGRRIRGRRARWTWPCISRPSSSRRNG